MGAVDVTDKISGSEYMNILDHLTEIRCPNCDVQLFRAFDPVAGEIVFCSECLAGGALQRGNQISRRAYRKLCHPTER